MPVINEMGSQSGAAVGAPEPEPKPEPEPELATVVVTTGSTEAQIVKPPLFKLPSDDHIMLLPDAIITLNGPPS